MPDQNLDNSIDASDRESESYAPGFGGSDLRRSAGKTTVPDSVRKQSLAKLKSDNPFADLQLNPEVDERDMLPAQREYRKKLKDQHAGLVRAGIGPHD